MIVTDLDHLHEQIPASPRVRSAVDFLMESRLQDLPDGRIEIDGDRLYALIQSYQTIPWENAKFEAHRRYIDFQFIASGSEAMGWCHLDRMTETVPYNDAKDVWYGKPTSGGITAVPLTAGQLAVLFPNDAHAPKLLVNQPEAVKKIVVKVLIA
jgi:biofilm protein TabA